MPLSLSLSPLTNSRDGTQFLLQGEACLWRDESAMSSISHGLASKILPNLPIWGIKRGLRGIMVNTGRIHREFRYFRDIFLNLVKLDDELRWEIRENGGFKKITSKQIHGIKNCWIWTWFRGEIEIWSGEKFSDVEIVILDEILWNWKLNPNLNEN